MDKDQIEQRGNGTMGQNSNQLYRPEASRLFTGAPADKTAHGRKRKSAVLEAVAAVPTAKVAQISERQITEAEQGDAQEPRAKVARTSKARAEEDWRTQEPWKAPMARMW
jgi:hypothetical protein